jgi:hypothetical protein
MNSNNIERDSHGFDDFEYEGESRTRWLSNFDDDNLRSLGEIKIDGSHFLLDSLEETELVFRLKGNDNKTLTVRGRFTHSFSEEQAARILRKKSVLNRTFKDIALDAVADTDIGIGFIERGIFIVTLKGKTFNVSDGDYSKGRDYMVRFLECIILIQNTESCE